MKSKFSYRVIDCIEAETSEDSLSDLKCFHENLIQLNENASKHTHYDRLNEWNSAVYAFVRNKLDKYGFINGSKEQNQDAAFWWLVYQVVGAVCFSVHMKTEVASHHASAWERNQALLADINDILESKITVK